MPAQLRLTFFTTLLLCALLSSLSLYGQMDRKHWYFGSNAGIIFTDTGIVATRGSLATGEGCATISDADGKLLFYASGRTIWNRNHQRMPNGFGLLGNGSSSQAALIIPRPGYLGRYYVIASNCEECGLLDGLSYSQVDMRLDNGLGDVSPFEKNVSLLTQNTEKLIAIPHANCQDFWLITHMRGNTNYVIFLVTKAGIGRPKFIPAGRIHGNGRGYLKASAQGDLLAAGFQSNIDLLRFDNFKGEITKYKEFSHPGVYGLEFSLDGRYLYSATRGFGLVMQTDLITGKQDTLSTNAETGALQRGPDGKIYLAESLEYSLGIIDYPEKAAPGCGYRPTAISLPERCQEGLPNFYTSCQPPVMSFTFEKRCKDDSVLFIPKSNRLIRHYLWDFADSVQGIAYRYDTSSKPLHLFSGAGKYAILLKAWTIDSVLITATDTIEIGEQWRPELGEGRTICFGDSVKLEVNSIADSVFWHTGSKERVVYASAPGVYTVAAFKDSCSWWDRVEIRRIEPPDIHPKDTLICEGDIIKVSMPDSQYLVYKWSTGDTTPSIYLSKAGTYHVVVDKMGCTFEFNLKVRTEALPTTGMSKVVRFCSDKGPAILKAPEAARYLWQPGGYETQQITINEQGQYGVQLFNSLGCATEDSVRVEERCPADIFVPTAFTPDRVDGLNDAFQPYGEYISTYEMLIYNRWGTKIYHSQDGKPWDGKYLGAFCTEDVYLYVLIIKVEGDTAAETFYRNGTVHLLR